ncbi:hypothetical protein CBI38_24695 [Rhodococcus oxybenzonivorans]|uniref:Uncharacterized protein n=1 Tax=Rhodococcus oxybenzonivorans TaxID=1990687 RepID=A0A2S2C066_9NOCA|nr:hypothetical protein [Rhodococcus oxybenzonivorans]AWK74277.1 hypothetical protein CBI38_24695 [Rhodococcus oxybenzonivorans]
MARMPRGTTPNGLREHLLREAEDFRDRYGHIDAQVFNELSKPVRMLASGQPVELRRYQLPADHHERCAGQPHDVLILDVGNRLHLEG